MTSQPLPALFGWVCRDDAVQSREQQQPALSTSKWATFKAIPGPCCATAQSDGPVPLTLINLVVVLVVTTLLLGARPSLWLILFLLDFVVLDLVSL